MIPKIIHYCWFGQKPMNRVGLRCLRSWERLCPDYEIRRWEESNFDLGAHPFLKWCHEQGLWAYLSDMARLMVVHYYGGIYFDTDVELIKRPDAYLGQEAFFGFETPQYVATGLGFGAVPRHRAVKAMLDEYYSLRPAADGNWPTIGCPRLNTLALEKLGLVPNGQLQRVSSALILPQSCMNPFDPVTGRLTIQPDTISIHWYSMSALSPWLRIRNRVGRPWHRLLSAFQRC